MERIQTIAYNYLCRLEEVKNWMIHIIQFIYSPEIKNRPLRNQVLTSSSSSTSKAQTQTSDLIQKLINTAKPLSGRDYEIFLKDGVFLAVFAIALQNFKNYKEHVIPVVEELPTASSRPLFASKTKNNDNNNQNYQLKFYEINQIYDLAKARQPSWKHMPNHNIFLYICKSLGLPIMFIPETTDIYDLKNIPKVIYCMISLSYLLDKIDFGTPLISDIDTFNYDKENNMRFTKFQIQEMENVLRDLGILPSCTKIENLIKKNNLRINDLGNEISKNGSNFNQAKQMAAILRLNEAINDQDFESFYETIFKCYLDLVEEEPYQMSEEFAQYLFKILHQIKLDISVNDQNVDDDEQNEEISQESAVSILPHIDKYTIQKEINLCYFNLALAHQDMAVFQRSMARMGFDFEIKDEYEKTIDHFDLDHCYNRFLQCFISFGNSDLDQIKFQENNIKLTNLETLTYETIEEIYEQLEKDEIRKFGWKCFEKSGLLSKFQALIRGANVRNRRKFLTSDTAKNAVLIIERHYQFYKLKCRADHFLNNLDKIVLLQRVLRRRLFFILLERKELCRFSIFICLTIFLIDRLLSKHDIIFFCFL